MRDVADVSSEIWTPEAIKALRKKMDLTQKQLANRLGVHPGTVTRWETGSFEPSALAYDKLDSLQAESRS
jgi:type I restriction enzyme M protein